MSWKYSSALLIASSLQLSCGKATRPPQGSSGVPGGKPAAVFTPRSATCAWPKEKAAVSLTYDDSVPTQLSTAVPTLAKYDLRATFFVNDVRKDPKPWSKLLESGHELGAHTLKHPCPAENDWVPEGNANEDYDEARLTQELDEQLGILRELGAKPPYTFAYPCGIKWHGPERQSYVPIIRERFSAARGVASKTAGLAPDFYDVPAIFLKSTGAELIARLSEARKARSWVVFGFHGIGGDWEVLPQEAHEELLAYLREHNDEFYVAPFGEISACLQEGS